AFANGFSFGKGNYAAYVSPEHSTSMRVYPGALINEKQPLKNITDGTSKTLLLAEVRTRDNTSDSRGAWAGGFTGGSIIAYDMHSDHNGAASSVNNTYVRNSPYTPIAYPGVDSLPPDTKASWSNRDYIRECADTNGADLEGMPCTTQLGARAAASPRSNH